MVSWGPWVVAVGALGEVGEGGVDRELGAP